MPNLKRPFRLLFLAVPAACLAVTTLPAVEPGVDIAVPRVAISTVDATIGFHPAQLTVETGDYARWNALATSLHTTTSGANCIADNLWNASLGTIGASWTQPFPGTPQNFPYFCSPHCGLGMVGQVTVTSLIGLTVLDASGTPHLSWAGGGPIYQVFVSDNPAFTGANTHKFPPDGGNTGTTFTDLFTPQPDLGRANFYLVMNQF